MIIWSVIAGAMAVTVATRAIKLLGKTVDIAEEAAENALDRAVENGKKKKKEEKKEVKEVA